MAKGYVVLGVLSLTVCGAGTVLNLVAGNFASAVIMLLFGLGTSLTYWATI
jgi:hypothetical protein